MIQLTSDQWLHWVSLYFWPLLRILALIATAPILSEKSVPKRVKLGLGVLNLLLDYVRTLFSNLPYIIG